jgi:N-formylglutamate amidohydrolase
MIEINRGRYMDETTGEKSAGFYKVKDEIERLLDDMIKFMK